MEESTNQSNLSLSTMVILGRLGRGGTSHVFKAQSTKNKKLYAMKVIDKKAKNYDHQALERELNIHKQLSNAHVIRLQGHFQDSDNHYVVTEYCQGGEMTRLITQDLSEQKIANIIHQIVLGLQYLHSQGIAHCDMKLSNMLIHKGRIKICDFGFSQNLNDQSSMQKQKSLCGTLYYLAPEILKDKKRIHHKKADIWGLGISLLVLLTKKQPYSGQGFQTLRKQIITGERQKLPQLSPQLTDLMEGILQMNPQKRINLNQILCHPFLLKFTSNLTKSQITVSKFFSKHQKKLNDKIQLVTRLTSQSQSEDKDNFNQNHQKQTYYEQLKIENKQEQNIKNWTFKRTQNRSNEQLNNYTIQKKIGKVQNTDYDKTIRNSKSIKQQATRTEYLTPIHATLIKPFDQFHYQTKNQGFIRILSDGQIIIKVKNITYQISADGQILNLHNKQYKLKELNTKGHTPQYKQPYQLYSYAQQVVDILKSKKYAITWAQKYMDKDLYFGITLDWKKIKCLSISKDESFLLQWIGNEQKVSIKRKGQKSTCKLIDDLGQLVGIFILMKDYFLQKSAQEQVQ